VLNRLMRSEGACPISRSFLRFLRMPVFAETDNSFPWTSQAMDLNKRENFFETRVIEYQNGGSLAWD
jgi:ribonucleotide reductase beta subunit family protein with ferritin-like domain